MTAEADEEGHYRPERLPQAAEQSIDEGTLRAALDVVRSVHQTSEARGFKKPKTTDECWEVARKLRLIETDQLASWAQETNLLRDADVFSQRWQEGGCIEGGEHQLYAENGFVYKRNKLLYHSSWLEYFHRLILHNWLFQETRLTFEGLMWVDGDLQPVVSQKIIEAIRGADQAEVEDEMSKRGFVRRNADNYHSASLGLLVEDLHDENVLISPTGSLFIFDPVIYIVSTDVAS